MLLYLLLGPLGRGRFGCQDVFKRKKERLEQRPIILVIKSGWILHELVGTTNLLREIGGNVQNFGYLFC